MASKLGPHYSGGKDFHHWVEAGTSVYKFAPDYLGASIQVPNDGQLVIGKFDDRSDNPEVTNWKAYKKDHGLTPKQTAERRFRAQENFIVSPNKPRINRYEVNPRIDVWEDDNEIVPDNPEEAKWMAEYCIEMMRLYESIGKKRANFSFSVGNPDIRPGDPNDIWPHLLPAVRHARDNKHYLALHEYMGFDADAGVGFKTSSGAWHGRTQGGQPVETYPYGLGALRYRWIYDLYLKPQGLHDTPLLITECGCDKLSFSPPGVPTGSWKSLRRLWELAGFDPENRYAEMLIWYDNRLREDSFVKGAMIFTVGKARGWNDWDIDQTQVQSRILGHIRAKNAALENLEIANPAGAGVDVGQEIALNDGDSTGSLAGPASLRISEFEFSVGDEVPIPDPQTDDDAFLERIIDQKNFLPAWFLERGALVQRAIARVIFKEPVGEFLPGDGWATGFMVSPSLFMTNNHVIPSKAFSNKVRAQFNYQLSPDGADQVTEIYEMAADDVLHTKPELDYTLIRLRPTKEVMEKLGPVQAGDRWGYIALNEFPIFRPEQNFNIIQHPQGRKKEIALQDNKLDKLFTNAVRYKTDTEKGSSGSPVMDNLWRLVALHHAGGDLDTSKAWINNEGIRIDVIVQDLRSHFLSTGRQDILDELEI